MKNAILFLVVFIGVYTYSQAQDIDFNIGASLNYQGYKYLNKYIENASFPSLQNNSKALEISFAKVFENKAIGFLYQNAYSVGQFQAKSSILKSNSLELVYTKPIDASKKINNGAVLGFGFGFSNVYLTEFSTNLNSISNVTNSTKKNEYVFARSFTSLLIAYRISYKLLEHEYILAEVGSRIYANDENYLLVNQGINLQQKINDDGYKLGFAPFISLKIGIY